MFAVRVAHASTGIATPRFSLYSSTSAVMYRARTCKSPTRPAVVRPMFSSSRYIFLLPFFSPPRPRPATSYDMSDLDRPRCRLVIRVSSSGGRRLHIQQQTLDPGGGPELDGVRDLLLRKRDVGGAHVHRDAVALFLRSEDLIPRDRDHLASLLILEEVVDRTRHRTKLHEKEAGIVRVALGRTREEEESHFVAKQVALHRAEQRHALPIVVHRDFRGCVGFLED